MDEKLRDRIRQATESSGVRQAEFIDLLKRVDKHYARIEATATRPLARGAISDTPSVEVIFDSVSEALMFVGEAGDIRLCNEVCTRYFGLTKEELTGARIESVLPAAKDRPLADFLEPFVADISDTHVEYSRIETPALKRGGASFVVELGASPIDTPTGRNYVISIRDVTSRREAEMALKENEERYRALVENAPEAIIVFDTEMRRFVDVNDKACELFNMSRKQLMAAGPEDITPTTQPDGTPSFGIRRGFIDRALAGEHPTFEWLHRDSTGREFPVEVRFSRIAVTGRFRIRASITDITARKRDESLAFAQNKILEMVASGTPSDRTLRAICRFVERISSDLRAAVMVLHPDGRRMSVEQAPSLPQPLTLCLDNVRIDGQGITCAAAVFDRQDRIASDIAREDAWQPKIDVIEDAGIGAVWSILVRGSAGRIIGTLDVYASVSRGPSSDELDKISRMARLAGIAVKRQQDEDRLRNSEVRYRGLFENVLDGVYIASREGDLIAANPALVDMLGYDSVDELKSVGRTTELYVNPVDRERVFARLEAEGIVRNFEYRLRRRDGREIVVLENSRAVCDNDGNIVAHEGTIRDITDRKQAETRIFEEKERAQVTLQSIGDGVITTDADGNIDYINPVAEGLTGWDDRSARGRSVTEIITIVNEESRQTVENPVIRCLKEGRVITLADQSLLIARNGDEIPIQDSAAPIRDRVGNITGSVMVFHDTSKESRLFRQLSYQASHDALTGLINRREFENRLVAGLEELKAQPDQDHALLYLDLDQFKVVNDTFGHVAGDELLRQLVDIVKSNIRSTDVFARLGGDEFGLLLDRCNQARAMEIAETIRNAIEGYRFEWQGSFTTVRASLGVVMVTGESNSVAELMSSADVACYSAKDMGRNQVHLYIDSDASLRHEEMKWVSRITRAVEDDRFELYYQPIIGIDTSNDRNQGHYELLLRMRDENGELVSPNRFIPAAERYNLMSTLDRWVVQKSLKHLADRSSDGAARYTIAINLSGTSLSEDRFLEFVINELRRHQLPTGAVCFEITETAAISNLSRVVHFMQTLKQLGCKFSLDDFGSGLSSFTYLKNLPVDYLKIDGQFVSNVADDAVDESMVRAINEVGQALGIETIAERVETREVFDKLGTLGIGFAQGYYIARPASVSSFRPWGEKPSYEIPA